MPPTSQLVSLAKEWQGTSFGSSGWVVVGHFSGIYNNGNWHSHLLASATCQLPLHSSLLSPILQRRAAAVLWRSEVPGLTSLLPAFQWKKRYSVFLGNVASINKQKVPFSSPYSITSSVPGFLKRTHSGTLSHWDTGLGQCSSFGTIWRPVPCSGAGKGKCHRWKLCKWGHRTRLRYQFV